jgi:hypothetical protein
LIRYSDRIFVFPGVDHRPAQLVQLLVFPPVSRDILLELLSPPLTVVLRHDEMLRTCMPEATVNENRYSSRSKDDVWTPRE